VGLLTRVVADAVAEGLIARSGVKAGDADETVGAEEPLAEWERELLQGDAEKTAVAATGGDAATEAPASEATGAAAEAPQAEAAAEAATEAPAEPATEIKPLAAVAEGEFGAEAAPATEDGSAPEGFEIKGNKDSMKFHAPSSPWYDRTNAEVWFRSAEAAEAAGFVNAEQKKD
jgi:small subunit ribosomal protein S2